MVKSSQPNRPRRRLSEIVSKVLERRGGRPIEPTFVGFAVEKYLIGKLRISEGKKKVARQLMRKYNRFDVARKENRTIQARTARRMCEALLQDIEKLTDPKIQQALEVRKYFDGKRELITGFISILAAMEPTVPIRLPKPVSHTGAACSETLLKDEIGLKNFQLLSNARGRTFDILREGHERRVTEYKRRN
ncbi:hypothetical protein KKE06_05085 [Candidatus Micrarchaeota archaeon]|nr:hypothetical protein [Candidatus Micrarchaeota archaeon]MBU1930804.1 hypothetical protein [Candidatus Micrarchaeota archaeon]